MYCCLVYDMNMTSYHIILLLRPDEVPGHLDLLPCHPALLVERLVRLRAIQDHLVTSETLRDPRQRLDDNQPSGREANQPFIHYNASLL